MIHHAAAGAISHINEILRAGSDINAITSDIYKAWDRNSRGELVKSALLSSSRPQSALNAAAEAEAGKLSTVVWLLKHGANVQSAANLLQSDENSKENAAALLKMVAYVEQTSGRSRNRYMSEYKLGKRQQIREVYARFVDQHDLVVMTARESSTNFRHLHHIFQGGHQSSRRAGIAAITALSRRKQPDLASSCLSVSCKSYINNPRHD